MDTLEEFQKNVPDSINADLMTTEEIHSKLRSGYDDAKAGKTVDAAMAFERRLK